jgi:uncharacterized membrane protein YeiH
VAGEPIPLVALDLIGISVFAVSGALAAVRRDLDVFGVLVLATVTALGGGVLRDVLLGATPPRALRDWPYLAVPAAAGLAAFLWHPQLRRLNRIVLLLDAAGLGLFTVTGTAQALNAGLGYAGSCVIGLLAGIGGGILRDVLLLEVPAVLQRDIYALAAVAGTVLISVGYGARIIGAHRTGSHALGVAWEVAAVAVVFAIRIVALRRRWSAPHAH